MTRSALAALLSLMIAAAPEPPQEKKTFKQEELDQLLAPIALYPDDLLSQVLMASTYAIEVVQAQRWADAHKDLKGDALATELEKQAWDPSVKSLVNFPQVLQMMSDKLDWSVRLGDAFLAQQKEVMDTVQKLRAKAKEAGNLKTGEEVKVSEDAGAIVVESASPSVIYVPVYDPMVVYGTWWWPTYPPYFWYPPYYRPRPGLWFGAGFALGMAWGYGWGHCNWHGGSVNINVNRNITINNNINRERYKADYNRTAGSTGNWQHDPSHRSGSPYRDSATTKKFSGGSDGVSKAYLDAFKGRDTSTARPSTSDRAKTSGQDRSAFNGVDKGGERTRVESNRGNQSRSGGGGGARRGGGGRR